MKEMTAVPWEKLYHVVLACGNIHELQPFCIQSLYALRQLCQFDQALIYFLDGNGEITNQHLFNIEEHWSNLFLQYYSRVKNPAYNVRSRVWRESSTTPVMNIHEWKNEPHGEFVRDYIGPLGIKCSLGFPLFDVNGVPRTVFALDKIREERFTEQELTNLKLVIPQLNNLHKKFFSQEKDGSDIAQVPWETKELTKREIEVANLLCQGVSPTNISKALHISYSTANKHIANIYKKMQVSSRQELLVRLLRKK